MSGVRATATPAPHLPQHPLSPRATLLLRLLRLLALIFHARATLLLRPRLARGPLPLSFILRLLAGHDALQSGPEVHGRSPRPASPIRRPRTPTASLGRCRAPVRAPNHSRRVQLSHE